MTRPLASSTYTYLLYSSGSGSTSFQKLLPRTLHSVRAVAPRDTCTATRGDPSEGRQWLSVCLNPLLVLEPPVHAAPHALALKARRRVAALHRLHTRAPRSVCELRPCACMRSRLIGLSRGTESTRPGEGRGLTICCGRGNAWEALGAISGMMTAARHHRAPLVLKPATELG